MRSGLEREEFYLGPESAGTLAAQFSEEACWLITRTAGGSSLSWAVWVLDHTRSFITFSEIYELVRFLHGEAGDLVHHKHEEENSLTGTGSHTTELSAEA